MAVEHGLAALARTMAATPRAPIPTFEWATVVAGTGEVHVVLDSDPTGTPRPVSDNAAGPVAVGQRVHVAHHGLTLTLLSAPTPISDTGWQPLELMEGFTGGVWYRLRDGEVRLHGRVIRDAGDWPTSAVAFMVLPVALVPSKPGSPYAVYLPAVSTTGVSMVLHCPQTGTVSARAATAGAGAWMELSGVSWRVD